MRVPYPSSTRRAGCGDHVAWVPLLHLLSAALLATAASGQVPTPPIVGQDGRLADANTQLGNPYNYARPVSPLIIGNALAGGNVRGGFAFRGYATIPDPMSFRASLGSSQLSAFRRDSVSIADAYSPYRGLGGSPYFDAARTAPTVGFLSGQYAQPVTPGPWSVTGARPAPAGLGAPLDLRLDTRLSAGPAFSSEGSRPHLGLHSQIVGVLPGGVSELASSIFGPPRARAAAPRPAQQQEESLPGFTRVPQAWTPPDLTQRDWTRPPPDAAPPGSEEPLGTPLDLVRAGTVRRYPLEPGVNPLETAEESPAPGLTPLGATTLYPGPVTPPAEAEETRRGPWGRAQAAGTPHLPTPRITDPSVLPGYDKFNDMQLALALAETSDAMWFHDMQAAIRQNPELAGLLRRQAEMRSQEFVESVLNSPITTFHGQGESKKNDELLKAESLMELGRYYEAANRYEVAHRLDPLDPLPLIGKGNALLAAGNYLSATVALLQGFERYPELSRFTLHLPALIGGREIIDIRRADLMKLLAKRDDARLRFLLGYLEYYSGDPDLRESGLRHFERAAELDRSGSIITRFPTLLRGEGTLPPPRLPDAVPRVPGADANGPLPDGPAVP